MSSPEESNSPSDSLQAGEDLEGDTMDGTPSAAASAKKKSSGRRKLVARNGKIGMCLIVLVYVKHWHDTV